MGVLAHSRHTLFGRAFQAASEQPGLRTNRVHADGSGWHLIWRLNRDTPRHWWNAMTRRVR